VHRDLRFLQRSQALTLCDLYGLAPALKLGEACFCVELFWVVAGGMLSHQRNIRPTQERDYNVINCEARQLRVPQGPPRLAFETPTEWKDETVRLRKLDDGYSLGSKYHKELDYLVVANGKIVVN
jgi:hypothetical protein